MFSLYDLQPDLPPLTVLDIGALESPGFPPPFAGLVAAGRARIIGFEPDDAARAALSARYGAPHRFLPDFVGNGAPGRFHASTRADTGSLLPPNMPVLELFTDLPENMRAISVQPVDTVRLDDVDELDDVDFMKIDVQGAEIQVLEGAARLLESVVAVQTEVCFVELYEGQPLFAEIDQHLRARDFWFHTFAGMASLSLRPIRVGAPDRGLNQRLWSDAIYCRSPLRFAERPPAKLRKLGAVLHDMYGSYDLALHALAAADRLDGGDLAQRYWDALAGAGL